MDRFLRRSAEHYSHGSDRGAVALTRPRFRVISSTKWEVNITKKYRVASSAIVLKIVGIWSPGVFVRLAKTMVNAKARKSEIYIFRQGQHPWSRFKIIPTDHRGGRCLYTPPLGFYAGQIDTGDMRRGVSVGVVELRRGNKTSGSKNGFPCTRGETYLRSSPQKLLRISQAQAEKQ